MVDGWCSLFSGIFFQYSNSLTQRGRFSWDLFSSFSLEASFSTAGGICHSAMEEKKKKVVVEGMGDLGDIHVPGGGGVFVNSAGWISVKI